jgi:hypothetical protein
MDLSSANFTPCGYDALTKEQAGTSPEEQTTGSDNQRWVLKFDWSNFPALWI